MARRSLAAFTRQAWETINPGRPLEWLPYLDAICLHLEAVKRREAWARRLLITQPPNTLKSTILSVCWPAWVWVDEPETRFLFGASDGPLATRDAVGMRDLVLSDWYQRAFRPTWGLKEDQDQKTWFSNTAGGHRISYSVSAKVVGRKGDILVVDDANDAKKASSAVDRQNVIDWHDTAFSGRTADERTSPEVVCGQRVHKGDLIGHLKAKGGWVELSLDEEYDPAHRCTTPIWSDPRTELGSWLRPARFGQAEKADRIKSLGSRGYSAQHRQRPLAAEGSMFQREWFRLIGEGQRHAVRVRYWDKAATQDGGKYTSGVLIAKDVSGRFVVEDVVRARLSALGRDELIKQTAALDKQRGRVIQAGEQEPGSAGKEVAEAMVRMLAGYEVRIDKVTGSKEDRAQPLASQCEGGNVFVLERPWTEAYLTEMSEFPDGEFSDQVDASSGAFNILATLSVASRGPILPNAGQGTMATVNDAAFR